LRNICTHIPTSFDLIDVTGVIVFSNSGNIDGPPGFVDVQLGNYRLSANSPCVDQGNNSVDLRPFSQGLTLLPPFDFAGEARVQDGNGDGVATVDIGAYEFARELE